MKLTKETLKQIIQEQMEEAITKIDPSLSVDQPDPNDNLFRIMDQVQDRAMEMMGMSYRQLTDDGDDFEFSKMSNEIVTLVSKGLSDIDGMAQELVKRFETR